MEGITTILFDIDGTVLDTRDFVINAVEHALSTQGYKVPERSDIAVHIGKSFDDLYYLLTGEKDSEKLKNLHRNFQLNNYHLSRPFPNTIKVLNNLKEKGYKIGAVTSRRREGVCRTLVDANILDLFDVVISVDDVKELKPDPEPLFKALENLKETPERAVMIGDSNVDIEAGKNAGTKTIRAVYGFHKDYLHNPEPDFIIKDISDLLKIL